jgi:hypothetical protein
MIMTHDLLYLIQTPSFFPLAPPLRKPKVSAAHFASVAESVPLGTFRVRLKRIVRYP